LDSNNITAKHVLARNLSDTGFPSSFFKLTFAPLTVLGKRQIRALTRLRHRNITSREFLTDMQAKISYAAAW